MGRVAIRKLLGHYGGAAWCRGRSEVYTIAWKDEATALADFCEIVNQQSMGGGEPVTLNNTRIVDWGGQRLIVHDLTEGEHEPLILGIMWEVKGMFLPTVVINEVQGLEADYPEVSAIRV